MLAGGERGCCQPGQLLPGGGRFVQLPDSSQPDSAPGDDSEEDEALEEAVSANAPARVSGFRLGGSGSCTALLRPGSYGAWALAYVAWRQEAPRAYQKRLGAPIQLGARIQ